MSDDVLNLSRSIYSAYAQLLLTYPHERRRYDCLKSCSHDDM